MSYVGMHHLTIPDLLDVYMHTHIRYISIDIYLYNAASDHFFFIVIIWQ